MIRLNNINLTILDNERKRTILQDAAYTFDAPRTAILEGDPKLRSALIGLLAQQIKPQSGHIEWQGRLSWPVGRVQPFRSVLTGYQQIDFFSRAYDLPRRKTLDLIAALMDEPEFLGRSFVNWPSKAQMQFAYAMALAPQFDIYLFDGSIRLPFNPFYDRWKAAFLERIEGRMLIMATGQPTELPRWCNTGVELCDLTLKPVDDIIDKAAKLRLAPVAAMQEQPAPDPEEDDLELF